MDSTVPLALAILQISALRPKIVQPPTNQTAVVGETVRFTCRVVGGYIHRREWNGLHWSSRGPKYRTLGSGDLEIDDVDFRDARQYTCGVYNRFNSYAEASAFLIVKKRTIIIEKPEDYEGAVGSTAKFRCIAVSDSSLTLTIDWLRNGKRIDFETDSRVVKKSEDNSLTITKIEASVLGTYTCVASTELDKTEARAALKIQGVPKPPHLESVNCRSNEADVYWVPTMSTTNGAAEILRYAIQFKSSFTPNKWQTARDNVSAAAQIYTVPLSPWANYTFQVVAWNKIGASLPSSPSKICATRPDVPYKNPANVRGTTTNNKLQGLLIRWTMMPEIEHNGPGFKYRVYYKRDTPRNDWSSLVIHNWIIEEIRIPNQPANQRYKVKVAAMNNLGESRATPTEVIVDSADDDARFGEFSDNETGIANLDSTQERRLPIVDPKVKTVTTNGSTLGTVITITTYKFLILATAKIEDGDETESVEY